MDLSGMPDVGVSYDSSALFELRGKGHRNLGPYSELSLPPGERWFGYLRVYARWESDHMLDDKEVTHENHIRAWDFCECNCALCLDPDTERCICDECSHNDEA